MVCPKCGSEQVEGATCPRCGVILARYRPRAAPPVTAEERIARTSDYEPGIRWRRLALDGVLLGLALGIAVWFVLGQRQRSGPGPSGAPRAPAATRSAQPVDSAAETPERGASPTPAVSPSASRDESHALAAADQALVRELTARLMERDSAGRLRQDAIGPDEVDRVEDLVRRYPQDRTVLSLGEAVLLRFAVRQSGEKQADQAIETLRRVLALNPASLAARLVLLRELSAQGRWPEVEREAREALALDARSAEAHEALGVALMRLGRDKEAIEELKAALALGHSYQAEALLAKLSKGQSDERGMKEQSLGYFTLRYEGEAHEAVGSEILRALEHHYATLTVTFGHRPSAPIPVILFTERAFYQATQAPRWSGGLYDNSDGRVRLPIGGLTTSLSPELDNVLIHELTHAFVADMSHGRAPLALHEGLAMHMEGKRLEDLLTRDQLRALADGRVSGVALTYLSGLAFAEYLLDQRGWGGIKDLLRAMGEGQEDPFKKVYGYGAPELGRAAEERLRQRYGS